jgi:hypothetical protein
VGVAGGVPYLSLAELPGNDGSCIAVGAMEGAKGCDHQCKAMRSLAGTSEQWTLAATAARPKWEAWLDATHKLDPKGQLEFGSQLRVPSGKSVAQLVEALE